MLAAPRLLQGPNSKGKFPPKLSTEMATAEGLVNLCRTGKGTLRIVSEAKTCLDPKSSRPF